MDALPEQQVDKSKADLSVFGQRQKVYMSILAVCFVICAAAVALVLWNDVKPVNSKAVTLKITPSNERQVEALTKIDFLTDMQIVPLEPLSARLVTTNLHRLGDVQKMLNQHHINYTIVNNGTQVA